MFTLAPNPLITEKEIKKRVTQMAEEIAVEYENVGPVMAIALLRGSYVFTADLLRELSRQGQTVQEIDFIIASSYGAATESSGNVQIVRDVGSDISGKHVLIIDDILDSGNTMHRLQELLLSRKPASLKICVLLDKPSRREKKIEADYIGFKIDDHFVVGYGLDFDQRFRELPYIGLIEERA